MNDISDSSALTTKADAGSAGTASIRGTLGFIGLGRMGTAMAANLTAAQYRVVAYIRHPQRAAELAALGIEPASEIESVLGCEIVITMLPDDAALREVVFGSEASGVEGMRGLAEGLAPGAIHLSMSTISPSCARDLATGHAAYGQGYVAAPVFGNPDAAKARELFVIAAGVAEQIERCQPILDALGQKTFVVGSDPAAANVIKLAGNVMTAVNLEVIGEVLALARKCGVDPEILMAVMTGTMYAGRVHRIYGSKIAGQQYTAGGFVLPLAFKDVRLALAEAEAAAVPMPLVSVVRDRMLHGIAQGYAHLDWSALGLIAAEEAGLPAAAPPPAA